MDGTGGTTGQSEGSLRTTIIDFFVFGTINYALAMNTIQNPWEQATVHHVVRTAAVAHVVGNGGFRCIVSSGLVKRWLVGMPGRRVPVVAPVAAVPAAELTIIVIAPLIVRIRSDVVQWAGQWQLPTIAHGRVRWTSEW